MLRGMQPLSDSGKGSWGFLSLASDGSTPETDSARELSGWDFMPVAR